MSFVHLLWLRLLLLWSLGGFALRVGAAIAASQRTLVAILLLATAVGLSASISHTVIVAEQQELALLTPPAPLLAQTTLSAAPITATALQLPAAKQLWDAYKQELSRNNHNRDILTNLILLASALDLQKDVLVYQRQLYLTDPLLSCTFSDDASGLLRINCPPSQL